MGVVGQKYSLKTSRAPKENSQRRLLQNNLSHNDRSPEQGKFTENLKRIITLRIMKRFQNSFRNETLEKKVHEWIDNYKRKITTGVPIFTESVIKECVRDIQLSECSTKVSMPTLQNFRNKSSIRSSKRSMIYTIGDSQRSVDISDRYPENLNRSIKTLEQPTSSFREHSYRRISPASSRYRYENDHQNISKTRNNNSGLSFFK
ncbi:unnamed protein product [Moneuplotes crassus]|uniref:Uncharacterized protein n=1 Tax=Euplotes crassus TaxID=5936 RepID=A0AAD1U596_EUPCR|nr:unnamed protein product [Moneuplotes crassus]